MNIFAKAIKEKQKKSSKIVSNQGKGIVLVNEIFNRENANSVATCVGNPYLHQCLTRK